MYNLLEYSDNYEDTTGSLYQFKRDEPSANNDEVAADTTSLKYKSLADTNSVKLIVPLKYISSFFRSSVMSLVNCKVDLELTWHKDCVISSNSAADNNVVSFKITDIKLYVPIVTLSTKDNTNLTKQLKDLKDLFIGIVIRQFHIQEKTLLLKESTDYLCLVLLLVIMKQHKTDIESIICQE